MMRKSYVTSILLRCFAYSLLIAFIIPIVLFAKGMAFMFIFSIGPAILIGTIASFMMALALSTFFRRAEMAATTSLVVFPCVGLTLYLVPTVFSKQQWIAWVCSLMPNASVPLAIISIGQETNLGYPYAPLDSIRLVLMDLLLYTTIYVYLDNVYPNALGNRKSLFFCCKRKESSAKPNAISKNDLSNNLLDSENSRSNSYLNEIKQSSAIYEEEVSSNNNKTVILELRGVELDITKYHLKLKAVPIDLQVFEGEIYSILGSYGSGKTQLFDYICGLKENLQIGKITYFGKRWDKYFIQQKNRIGACPSLDLLFPYMTVQETLKYFAKIRDLTENESLEQIPELLKISNLDEQEHRLVKRLSPALLKKLLLAIALLGSPNLVFLDEITSGLSRQDKNEIWKMIKKFNNEKRTTFILSTKSFEEAEEISDRIAVLYRGTLFAVGTPSYIQKNLYLGYTLSVTPTDPSNIAQIRERVLLTIYSNFEHATPAEDYTEHNLSFRLPFAQQSYYAELFRDLEAIPDIKLNLQLKSFEKAFLDLQFVNAPSDGPSNFGDDRKPQSSSDGIARISYNRAVPTSVLSNNKAYPFCIFERPTSSILSQILAIYLRKFYITAGNYPFWLSMLIPLFFLFVNFQYLQDLTELNSNGELLTATLMLVFIWVSAPCGSLIVYEREHKIREMLRIMGCNRISYWIGNVTFDIIATLCVTLGLLLTVSFYSKENSFLAGNYDFLAYMMLLYGIAITTLSYLLGFLWERSRKMTKYFNPFLCIILIIIPNFVLYFSTQNNLETLSLLVRGFAVLLSPSFIFQQGITKILLKNKGLHVFVPFPLYNSAISFHFHLIAQAVAYFLLAIWFDKMQMKIKPEYSTGFKIQTDDRFPTQRDELRDEIQRVESQENNDLLKIFCLQKISNDGKVLLHNLTFGVEEKQVMGIVGPEETETSVLLNILAGLDLKTSGSIRVFGKDLPSVELKNQESLGYMASFVPLWENLSVQQHLQIFCRVKGFGRRLLSDIIQTFKEHLELETIMKTPVNRLNYWEKRRICLFMSIIGCPDIILMHMPDKNLDLTSRKFLLNWLAQSAPYRNGATIMTFESFEEAERLSNKISIMFGGRFVSIGKIQDLQKKYCQLGYRILIWNNSSDEEDDDLDMKMSELCNAKKISTTHSEHKIYLAPEGEFFYSEVIKFLTDLQKQSRIKKYRLYKINARDFYLDAFNALNKYNQ